MTFSRRCYKDPFTHRFAVDFIRNGRGTHVNPVTVDTFLELNVEFRQIALRYAGRDEEREMLRQDAPDNVTAGDEKVS